MTWEPMFSLLQMIWLASRSIHWSVSIQYFECMRWSINIVFQFSDLETDIRAVVWKGSRANSLGTSGYSSCTPNGRMLHSWRTITVSIHRLHLVAVLRHDGFSFIQVTDVKGSGQVHKHV